MKHLTQYKFLGHLFFFLLFTYACSSDDSTNEQKIVDEVKKEKLLLTANFDSIYVGEEIYFTAKSRDGKEIDAEIYSTEGNILQNNKWVPQEVGHYRFTAKKEGYLQSDELTITVSKQDEEAVVGKGSFTFKDQTYEIQKSILSLEGRFRNKTGDGYLAGWIFLTVNEEDDIAVLSMFYTPVHSTDNGKEIYELPKAGNIQEKSMKVVKYSTDKPLAYKRDKTVDIQVDFGELQENNIISGSVITKCDVLEGSPFTLEYKGQTKIDLEMWDY